MGWVTDARDALLAGRSVDVRPRGGSMQGRVEDGQLVRLAPASIDDICADDVVFVRWKGNCLLHLVLTVEPSRVLIGNTLGKTNGWVTAADVLGKMVESAMPVEFTAKADGRTDSTNAVIASMAPILARYDKGTVAVGASIDELVTLGSIHDFEKVIPMVPEELRERFLKRLDELATSEPPHIRVGGGTYHGKIDPERESLHETKELRRFELVVVAVKDWAKGQSNAR